MKQNFRYTFTAFIGFLFAFFATSLLFPILYRFFPAGINIFLCVGLFYAAVLLTMRGRYSLRRGKNWLLFFPIGISALQFALFNNGLLSFLNLVLLVFLVGIQIALMTGLTKSVFTHNTCAIVAHMAFVRPFHKIRSFYANVFAQKNKKTKKAIGGIFAGVAVTLPIFAVLLLLLTSADIIFAEFVSNIFSWKSLWRILYFLFLIAVIFTLTGSFIVSLKEKKHMSLPAAKERAAFHPIAVYILTVSLSVLMIFFCAFQVLYMTGLSEIPYNFSYSTYARRGFFQMLAAAAIVFLVIAVCERHTKNADRMERLILSIIYTVLTATVLVLLTSSFSRLVLYEQVYRFTRLRLYTQAFIILLGVVCIFMIIKLWVPRFRLTRAVFFSAVSALLLLTFLNVDGWIAKDAVAQAKAKGETPDLAYLSSLSEDALPYYIDYLTPEMFEIHEPYATNFYESVSSEDWEEYYATISLAERIDAIGTTIKREDLRTWNRTRAGLKDRISDEVLSAAQELLRESEA